MTGDRVAFPEPSATIGEPAALITRTLDYLRDAAVHKLRTLDEHQLRSSAVPSGWTPLELLTHLAHMERRWIQWGFLGEDVVEPWGDHTPDEPERWHVPDGVGLADVEERLAATAARTRRVLDAHPLDTPARTGGRFESDPPTLGSIALHVVQEYARHLGHLDVAVEVMGGPVGE